MVITEEVVKVAARNGESGKEMMILLLEQRGANVVVTEEVVKVIVSGFVDEMMIYLLSGGTIPWLGGSP